MFSNYWCENTKPHAPAVTGLIMSVRCGSVGLCWAGVVADVGHFVRGHFGNRVFGTPWDPSSIIAGTSSSVFPLPRFLHPPVQSLPRPLCWGEGCGQVGGEERDGGELPSPPPPGPRATTLLPGNSSAARRGVPTWPRQLRRGWGAVSRGGGEGCG